MIVDARILHGLSYDRAVCMGMPHIGCTYAGDDAKATRVIDGAVCAACGQPARNAHHEPPLGMGGAMRGWTLRTEWGLFVLKPALIALCGSGTTGCHGARHKGLLRFRWEWDDEDAEAAWWSGWLLAHGYQPHDRRLLEYGHWRIEKG